MDEKYPLALPVGAVLAGQYVIEKVLGQGGFGITYEAMDHKSGDRVAVKEFFPDAMATRTHQTTVLPFSGERGESYEYGKTCFLQEAETLAQFIGNENIVRIYSYFEENGTAYFVMEYIEGTSFDEYIKQRGGKVSFEEAVKILVPVMDALAAVHARGIVHRDVTPDNIYITNDGVVKLLDFGAARYSLGDKSRSLDIVLKHGFAPKEQYTRRGKQGPFTDVYSLGATFYFALTGKRPPDSVERMDEDDLVPPSVLGVQISQAAEEAILMALNVSPGDRYQNMTAFKNAMLHTSQGERPQPDAGKEPVPEQRFFTAPVSGPSEPSGPTAGGPAPGAWQTAGNGGVPIAPNGKGADGRKGASKKIWAAAGAAAAVLLLIGIVTIFIRGREKEPVISGKRDSTEYTPYSSQGVGSAQASSPSWEATPEPTTFPSPEPTAVPSPEPTLEPAEVWGGDYTLISNAGNIMNGGITTVINGVEYYISEGGHCVKKSEDDTNVLTAMEVEETFSNLTAADGRLYFLYGEYAYSYDPTKEEDEDSVEEILSLNNPYGGRIQRLLLTKDYYVICCRNNDGGGTVYCVSRASGESRECCTVDNEKCFTLSADGWIYYMSRKNDQAYVYRMELGTWEQDKSFYNENSHIVYCNPLLKDGYFYFGIYSTKAASVCTIGRMPVDLTVDDAVYWQIGSKIEVCSSAYEIGFNMDAKSQSIYLNAAEKETDTLPRLYQIKMHDDGEFDYQLINTEAYNPCFLYYKSGNYDVEYFHRVINEDGTESMELYYNRFDENGNKIATDN